MMGNVKTVAILMGVSLVVVLAMAFGLSKLGDKTQVVKVDMAKLVEGARFISGSEKAKVTVVEFSDVQCPACAEAALVAKELRSMENVRFIYRDFPLITIHKNAWRGARAVEAGRLIGKGWEMLDLMFEKQSEWADSPKFEELVVGYAKSLGMDQNEFLTRWNSEETDKLVKIDSDLAGELKLSGTPTFFVDGEQIAANFVISKVKELLK
jgi:protein-disulfide isomerase